MIDNYNKIIEKVASSCGLSKEEIDRKVEAKRAKLSGLISREGALQVIAAELGVNFDNEKFKIDELLPGMRKVNVSGKIFRLENNQNNTIVPSINTLTNYYTFIIFVLPTTATLISSGFQTLLS